jgi:class 3 adenylate cyclase
MVKETYFASTTVLRTEGERKCVTVLFSDLSGYTDLTARLDPEDVKDIMSQIFREISQTIRKYDGFIVRFIGDAVMALFGVPKAHEDDAVRAIKAAKEIHAEAEALGTKLKERIGMPLLMHSGINTGLALVGTAWRESMLPEIIGNTINLASRIQALAKADEILAGHDAYLQAQGHFYFETLDGLPLKGGVSALPVYRVLGQKQRPATLHRLTGMRADFVGRGAEMAQLRHALKALREGKAGVITICGDAGTGKSRLLEEFKASLDLGEIQWRQGNAYPHTQNTPYFPWVDLFNPLIPVKEDDSPERLREKIESWLERLSGGKEDIAPFAGSLYALNYPELVTLSPEGLKLKLQRSIHRVLSAIAATAPSVFCLEDLHWADPSSLDLLGQILLRAQYPAIFLCVQRPTFALLSDQQIASASVAYAEIHLEDLSPSEAYDMLKSVLKTDEIPVDLQQFVQNKAEGNPFYLEELVNSLIESGALVCAHGAWTITKPCSDWEIPSSIHEIITARVDRLDAETKRLLQEASVTGRRCPYEILKSITEVRKDIDPCLNRLEQMDLLRRVFQPDLAYVFKHALIQEVTYAGLLKSKRREIHERIGKSIERLQKHRLPEFYETLAHHYKNGLSRSKAFHYLVRASKKCLSQCAVAEAHQYLETAFGLLSMKKNKTREDEERLIDLIND